MMAVFCNRPSSRSKQPVFDAAQLEQVFMERRVRLSGFFLTGRKEALRGFGVNRLPDDNIEGDSADDAEDSNYIQLISVKQDPGSSVWGGSGDRGSGEADAVLNGSNPFIRPALGFQFLAGKFGRGVVVVAPISPPEVALPSASCNKAAARTISKSAPSARAKRSAIR
jgi:hypothetical protein